MAKEVTLSLLKSQLTPAQLKRVDDSTLEEVNKLAHDPDYGPEFLESYIDHLHVLDKVGTRSHDNYLRAMKFFSLVQTGNKLVDAYIKVFNDRWEERLIKYGGDEDKARDTMRGEASRYNQTKMLIEIRKIATVPVQLVHMHLLHEAILEQADLMRNARSEMVRQKAGEVLIKELKPVEDATLTVEVADGSRSAIADLQRATQKLASMQRKHVEDGTPLKDIAEAKIIDGEFEEVPADGS